MSRKTRTDPLMLQFGRFKGTHIDDVEDDAYLWDLSGRHWVEIKYPEIYAYLMDNLEAIKENMKKD